jgi:hypothetical protein
MIDTDKYQSARQNMKFVTRSLRSLATKLRILKSVVMEVAWLNSFYKANGKSVYFNSLFHPMYYDKK